MALAAYAPGRGRADLHQAAGTQALGTQFLRAANLSHQLPHGSVEAALLEAALPDGDDRPAAAYQQCVVTRVAGTVAGELCLPELHV